MGLTCVSRGSRLRVARVFRSEALSRRITVVLMLLLRKCLEIRALGVVVYDLESRHLLWEDKTTVSESSAVERKV
jgi:cell division protein FtsL